MKTIKNLFRRKITKKFIEKHFKKTSEVPFGTYYIGVLDDYGAFYETHFYIEDREDRFCVCRGWSGSSYWIADVEYVYQLRRLLSLYNLKNTKS